MTHPITPIDMDDLTPQEIERLMRVARRERSIMAHKIMGSVFSTVSTALKNGAIKLAQVARGLATRLLGGFTAPPAAPGATKGMSRV